MKRKLLLIVFAAISLMASCQDHDFMVPPNFHAGFYLNGILYTTMPSGTGNMVYPGIGIPISTGTGWAPSLVNNSANWNTAYLWGNHAAAGYLRNFTETDPIFNVSPAKGITLADIAKWNAPGVQLQEAIQSSLAGPPKLTQAEINALTPAQLVAVEGVWIYNRTTKIMQYWNTTVWKVPGNTN